MEYEDIKVNNPFPGKNVSVSGQSAPENKEKKESTKMSKKILEELKGNYQDYTEKSFLKELPENLPVPENVKEVKNDNDKTMTEAEMTKGQNFFTKEEAFGLASKFVEEKKSGWNIIWFEDNRELYKVGVYDDGQFVHVNEFDADYEWGADDVSYFRN